MDDNKTRKPLVFSSEHASGRDLGGSSLVPMLIAGLIMIAMGYTAIMVFV